MLRSCIAAMILSACLGSAQATPDLTGTWGFTHFNDRFQGWVVIQQSGNIFRGTWHTSKGKTEPDDVVTGRVDGNRITLWRFIGDNKQNYALILSADGNRLDGFGDGFFLNHTDLSMQRSAVTSQAPAAAPGNLSGRWTFTCANDRFQGTIKLRQDGSEFTGTWHTSKGKSEPDDDVTGRIDGNTVTLWRFIGKERQDFVLTLSTDKTRLDGYGDGFFLNHTNLNMQRVVAPK